MPRNTGNQQSNQQNEFDKNLNNGYKAAIDSSSLESLIEAAEKLEQTVQDQVIGDINAQLETAFKSLEDLKDASDLGLENTLKASLKSLDAQSKKALLFYKLKQQKLKESGNYELKVEAEVNRRKKKIEAQQKAEVKRLEAAAIKQRFNGDKDAYKQWKKDNKKKAEEELKEFKLQAQKKYKWSASEEKKNAKKKIDEAEKLENDAAHQRKKIGGAIGKARDSLKNTFSPTDADGDKYTGGAKFEAIARNLVNGLSDFAKQMDTAIENINQRKGRIDTRLQGLNGKYGGQWDDISKTMTSVSAVSPYFKQETYAQNISNLVDQGIAFNLEQRAFLQTISDKIAYTFDANDASLKRLIRIQNEDTTAARLGMESALTSFLNNMYQTTEYLSDVANSVRGSLEEMSALMGGEMATEVEYQVQKWMGALYSAGMGSSAVSGIASAFGSIASGDISALTGAGQGNLLIMAANESGIQISDVLAAGLDAETTNKLMTSMVEYLAKIANSSDSKVVQQQLANVYGIKASDLKAASSLVKDGSITGVTGSVLGYNDMLTKLNSMANSMYRRTSIGEMTSNLLANANYTMASSIANNPLAYGTYKMASILDATTGGIAIPSVTAFGNGVDLETTVADLMRVGALSGGLLASIGSIASGLGNSFNVSSALNKLGVGNKTSVSRGNSSEIGISVSGATVSNSGFIGNSSGGDIYESTMAGANDSVSQKTVEASEAEELDVKNAELNESILKIYDLLYDVIYGGEAINTKAVQYGLLGTMGQY